MHELAHIELNQLEQVDNDLFALKAEFYEDEADCYLKGLLYLNSVKEKDNQKLCTIINKY